MPVSRTVTEFLAFLMAYFPAHLDACMPGRKGRMQGMAPIDGRHVPAASALAVMALAGSEATTFERAVATHYSSTARRTAAFKSAMQRFAAVLEGAEPLSAQDRTALAAGLERGLGAGSAARPVNDRATALLVEFEGLLENDLTHQLLTARYRRYQVTTSQEATADDVLSPELIGLLRDSASRLRAVPGYYPQHLATPDFARAMRLHEVSAHDLAAESRASGLYSDLGTWGDGTSAFEVLMTHRRLVVLGDPGGGKSTLLAGFAAQRIGDESSSPADLTLLARLEDLGRFAAQAQIRRPAHWMPSAPKGSSALVDAWEHWLTVTLPGTVRDDVLVRLTTDRDAFVLLDGLDEISDPSLKKAAVRAIQELNSEIAGSLVIASRVTGYTNPLHGAVEYVVARLREEETERTVESWFPKEPAFSKARARARRTLANHQARDLARNPLMLGFICLIATVEEVDSTLTGLYVQVIDKFLTRSWRPEPLRRSQLDEVLQARKVATDLAWAMATTPSEDPPPWRDRVSLSWMLDAHDLSDALPLYEAEGILVPYGPAAPGDPSQQVRWLHRTLHEHLVGRRLSELVRHDRALGIRLLQAAALRPSWREPLRHVAGFLSESGHLNGVVDDLLQIAASSDTRNGRLKDSTLDLLLEVHSTHRIADQFNWLVDCGYFAAAARFQDQFLALIDDAIRWDAPRRHDFGAAMVRSGMNGLPDWFDRLAELNIEFWLGEKQGWTLAFAMYEADPHRAIDRLLDPDAAPSLEDAFWRTFSDANPAQADRLVEVLEQRLQNANEWTEVSGVVMLAGNLPKQQRVCARALITQAQEEWPGLTELFDAYTGSSRLFDPQRIPAAELERMLSPTGRLGPSTGLGLGFRLAELGMEPAVDQSWPRLGWLMAMAPWTDQGQSLASEAIDVASEIEEMANQSDNLGVVANLVAQMHQVHHSKAAGEGGLQSLSRVLLEVIEQSALLDSVWITQFYNSLPALRVVEAAWLVGDSDKSRRLEMANLIGDGFSVAEENQLPVIAAAAVAHVRRLAHEWLPLNELRLNSKPDLSRALLELAGEELEAVAREADEHARDVLLAWLDERRFFADLLCKDWPTSKRVAT